MGSDDSDEVDKRDRVLAPDDLDITKRPEVEEIDDGRFVVSPNGPAKKPDRELLENPDWLDNDDEDDAEQPAQPPATQQPTNQNQPSNQSTQATQTPTEPPEQSPPADTTKSQPSTKRSQPTTQPLADGTPQQSTPNQPQQNPQNPQNTQQPRDPQQPNRSQHTQNPQNSQQHQSTPQNRPADTQPSTPQNQPATNQSTPANSQSTNTRTDQPTNRELAAHDQPPAEPPAAEITNENVSKFLAQSLANAGGDYGFDATLNVEGSVNRGRMTSDDIGETLETLLRWYARQTTDEVEPEHVLGIILAGSDLAVEYPVQSAYEVVKQHGLGPDDSISDLLAAVREAGSFTVPPSKE